jgi:hypothetical protein
MTITALRLVCLELAVSITSCTSVPELERTGRVAQAVSADVPGYVHDLSRSHFRIGQNVSLEVATPIQRWHGTLGTFGIDTTTNMVYASLDAQTSTGPYILDEATHATRVEAYFVGAGLPADQVGNIEATYMSGAMGGSVLASDVTPQLESINTILRRRVSGVPVIESEAWAKMTTAGDVDMEYVFWPPIDQSIVTQAVAFASAMSDPGAHSTFIAKLPGGVAYADVGVVIHHTSPAVHAAPVAYVAYDAVVDAGHGAAARHFDVNGAEFRLPQEQPTPRRPAATRPL